MPSCDATAVVGERVAFWSALTEEQERARTVALPDAPLLVRASAEDLAAAVDALLENVIAHTPEGTAFGGPAGRSRGGARLEVADDGPGPARRERGARAQRPRLDRPGPRHRAALRRGQRRLDVGEPITPRRRPGHPAAGRPAATTVLEPTLCF